MFLKKKNIIFKIRRSKVTDYAALNDAYQIRSLKMVIAFGLFNCTYKTLYLKYKSKRWIFSNQNEFVSTK